MASFNKVMLMGNLTRDPQVRTLPGGNNTNVAEFGLATSRRFRTHDGEDREDVCFVDCTAFGKQADVIAQFCTKGKPIFIEGRLKYDSWDDKNGGGKRSKLSVVVENFQFVGGRDSGGAEGQSTNDRPWQKSSARRADTRRPNEDRELPFDDKKKFKEADIPF
jgi:single-strand DNA-binding protein